MADVIVIGGGPAGMVAAIRAAEAGADTVLLERGPAPGRKLLLTGGGRCNLTTDRGAADFVRDCGPAGRFLRVAVGRFDPAATRRWFADLGVPTVREADGRCFPASGRATDVLRALREAMRRAGVRVRTDARVTAVRPLAAGTPPGAPWDGPRLEVEGPGVVERCRSVVLATGGRSYPATGSSGDGHGLASALGHAVTPPCPGEVPLVAGPAWVRDLAGAGLPDAVLRLSRGDRRAEARGAVLFAHFGLTGPAVMDASRAAARWLGEGPVDARLDLAPDADAAALDAALREAAARDGARHLATLLRERLPERLARRIAALALPGGDGPVARLPAAGRRAAVGLLKGLPLSVTGTRGFDEAVVTVGGVATAEVDPATMESRRVPGLHFAGEVLDVDGPRGGYNLQIAFSTGHAAGLHAAAR